jgi:hypothetical protein
VEGRTLRRSGELEDGHQRSRGAYQATAVRTFELRFAEIAGQITHYHHLLLVRDWYGFILPIESIR